MLWDKVWGICEGMCLKNIVCYYIWILNKVYNKSK